MHLQHKILFFIGLLGGMSIMAQTTTNWPYSVYGIGDIQPNGFPQSKAMGGAGIAVPCETSLNNLNPACYQGIDKYTVLLEGGINSRLSQFRDGIWTQNNTNINFNYLAIGFRTTDWWVLSLGLAPYSTVGASVIATGFMEGSNNTITNYYNASGGINQFYWGNSIKLSKNLSVGVNIKYLFGSVNITQAIVVPGVNGLLTTYDNQYMSNVTMDYGFIYSFVLNHNIKGSIGGVLSNPWTLGIRHEVNYLDQSGDTLRYINDTLSTYRLPLTYGLGLSLKFYNKLTLAFDYNFGDWSKAYETEAPNATSISFAQTSSLQSNAKYVNSNSFNIGAEFLPSEAYGATYWKKIKYRFGIRVANSPLSVNGYQFTDMAVTWGVGLPVLRNRMNTNISFELGHRGNDSGYGLIVENYGLVSINFSFLDYWFIKRKFN